MDDDRSYGAPIKIKATCVQHRYDEVAMEWMADGRFEIQWSPNEPWINLGISSYSILEWQLITANHAIGARHSKGAIEFIVDDQALKRAQAYNDAHPRGCSD